MGNDESPAGVPAPPTAARPWGVWAVVALLIAASAGAAYWYWSRPDPAPPPAHSFMDDIDPEPDLLAVPNPGYVGPKVCAECHRQRADQFQATTHARACRVPAVGDMPVGFEPGRGGLVPPFPGIRFEMTHSGNDFFENAYHATPAGETKDTSRIALAYGANKADEVYFTWQGDKLRELPMAWLHPLNAWGVTPFDPHLPGDCSRDTTPRCLECHTTWVEHVPGTHNEYNRSHEGSFILGVTCERCHGPGHDHVEHHRAHPDDHVPHAVVTPGKLSRERRLDLCTQCHSSSSTRKGPAFAYRPGEPLEDHFRNSLNRNPEGDHVANQIKYLRQSKCFQKSDMTCVTCHDPHAPHEEVVAKSRRSCLKCHAAKDCTDHDRQPEAVRADCVGCHLPARLWVNVHFHTADDQFVPVIRRFDHRIAVHADARDEVLLAWHRSQPGAEHRKEAERLAASLVKHYLSVAEKEKAEYRFLAAIAPLREAVRVDPRPELRDKLKAAVAIQTKLADDLNEGLHLMGQRRFAEAIAAFERAIAVKPDYALALAQLGTIHAEGRQFDKAAEYLRAAARADPDDAYSEWTLGRLAYIQNRPEDAVEHYRRAETIQPYDAKINFSWGLALTKLGRLPEAGDRFRKALRVDPVHAGAAQALATVLLAQRQPEEALRYAKRAARLTRFEESEALLTLAEAYAAAGRADDARQAGDKALATVPLGNASLEGEIRRRLNALQYRAVK